MVRVQPNLAYAAHLDQQPIPTCGAQGSPKRSSIGPNPAEGLDLSEAACSELVMTMTMTMTMTVRMVMMARW